MVSPPFADPRTGTQLALREKLVMPLEILSDSEHPRTATLQRALSETYDRRMIDDFLFLERWEASPCHGPATALRVSQIRRANPELANAIRSELTTPLRSRDAIG
jgi:hypothetical protein